MNLFQVKVMFEDDNQNLVGIFFCKKVFFGINIKLEIRKTLNRAMHGQEYKMNVHGET